MTRAAPETRRPAPEPRRPAPGATRRSPTAGRREHSSRRLAGEAPPSGAWRQRGQATVEAVAALPLLILLGLVALQALAVGYAGSLAANAAEAGALALAAGGDAEPAARAAVPGWSRSRMRVEARGGRVRVELRPPSPLAALSRALAVETTAAVEDP